MPGMWARPGVDGRRAFHAEREAERAPVSLTSPASLLFATCRGAVLGQGLADPAAVAGMTVFGPAHPDGE